jgi:Na+/H+ antiporter NhaD/arsenite permease-like protein
MEKSQQKQTEKFLWILTIFGSVIGGMVTITGAPIGVAFAVIPYCLARAVSELGKSDR